MLHQFEKCSGRSQGWDGQGVKLRFSLSGQRAAHEDSCPLALVPCPNSSTCGLLRRSKLEEHRLVCKPVPNALIHNGQCTGQCFHFFFHHPLPHSLHPNITVLVDSAYNTKLLTYLLKWMCIFVNFVFVVVCCRHPYLCTHLGLLKYILIGRVLTNFHYYYCKWSLLPMDATWRKICIYGNF